METDGTLKINVKDQISEFSNKPIVISWLVLFLISTQITEAEHTSSGIFWS